MSSRRILILIWACFLARGFFYCSFVPLWEGFDEWAHFEFIAKVANGELLPGRNEPVSLEVSASLRLAPVPWELREYPEPWISEDGYWRLSAEERSKRQTALRETPESWSAESDAHGPAIYEALQPPLYYWLCAVPYLIFRHAPLTDRVFLLRYLNVLVASLIVPLAFWAARRAMPAAAALCASALISLLPELLIDVCRVANDPLAIVLYSWLLLIALDLVKPAAGLRPALWGGVALGCGLLTKAYLLAAIPALLALYAWLIWRGRQRRGPILQATATFGVAALIAGWWYIRNRITTGTWSGLSEAVMLRNGTWKDGWTAAWHLPWGRAADSILMSHIWFGGWSSLTVRSWMYHAVYLAAALGCVGVIRQLRNRRQREVLCVLSAVYLAFWAAQAYNVLLLYRSKQAATSMGWYMYGVVVAEVLLLAVGLRALAPEKARGWVLPGAAFAAAALDLYTVNWVSIPYYTGMIAHRPSGPLAAFHPAVLERLGMGELMNRLSADKPVWLAPPVLLGLWITYGAATVVLVSLCCSSAHTDEMR